MIKDPNYNKRLSSERSSNSSNLFSRKREALTLDELKNKYLSSKKATA